ncbi:MAG: HAD-IA family hydrolase [Pseudomonadota bacterium]
MTQKNINTQHSNNNKPCPITVLFDLDGTLVDSTKDLYAALQETFGDALPDLDLGEVHSLIREGGLAKIRDWFHLHHSDPAHLKRLSQLNRAFAEQSVDFSTPFPGIEDLLAFLAEHQIPWGIVTNKIQRLTTPLLERLGWATQAKVVVCGDTLSFRKPHPAPLWRAQKAFSNDLEDTFFVGDSQRDIQAASAAGMIGVLACFGSTPGISEASAWGADHLITEPHALKTILLTHLTKANNRHVE